MIASNYQGPRTRTIRPNPKGAVVTRKAMLEARLPPGVTPVAEAPTARNIY